MAGLTRQGIPVPGPGMPPQGTPSFAATASVAPEPLDQVDTTSTLVPAAALTGTPLMPDGGVPKIGVPNSQDYPRLVFTAPYFGPNDVANMITTETANVQTVLGSGNVTVSAVATYVAMRQAAPAAVTISLPANPPPGRTVAIKDSLGVCFANNFTINTTDGTLIDLLATYVFVNAFQAQTFVFDGTGWGVSA